MFFSKQLSPDDGLVSDGKSSFWQSLIGSSRSSAGVKVTADSALALTVVQNCVTLLAESVAQLPLELYRRLGDGKREAAIHHPLYDVLRYQPNPWQTPYEYREYSQLAAGMRGNAFSFIERADNGAVKALYPLHNDQIQVLKGTDLLPCYRIGGHAPLPMRLIHHVRWHTRNHYTGLSPIELHADAVGLAQAVRHYAGKSFANGTAVSGVIERPKESPAIRDMESIDRILDRWGEKFAGIDNAKKVALLQEGMTFKPVSMNNVDSELLGIMKATGLDVARIYKIPPHMVNDLEKASYNSLEQLLIQYVIFALMPWVKRHEQAMMRDFLLGSERKDYFIEFNLSGLLRGDQKSRYDAYAVGRQWGWLSINDIRRLENMPPVANGDSYLQPLNMVDVAHNPANPDNPDVRARLEQQRDDILRMLGA
ncbi:phage portal protein [Pseudomonas sp. 21LCFQ010]|uniref:phage portal protein n=1 Tax=Pseudomonas sp. 21LCFQ010 TaxID=2957506 RepID=UPI00209840A3|nr:phage portal protein [Pseudomonas sp. 21LCFQ010]MCO8164835.1 phage portal protein [Pseudomonas sp. 21LCFQ010]